MISFVARKTFCKEDRNSNEDRPDLEDYFLGMALYAALRSPCPKGKRHGALLVMEKRVLSMGYNGPPVGEKHCDMCFLVSDDLGKDWRTCPAVHAEMNVIAMAARFGIKVGGTTMYVTKEPCFFCRNLIINVGLEEVIFYG